MVYLQKDQVLPPLYWNLVQNVFQVTISSTYKDWSAAPAVSLAVRFGRVWHLLPASDQQGPGGREESGQVQDVHEIRVIGLPSGGVFKGALFAVLFICRVLLHGPGKGLSYNLLISVRGANKS